MFYVKDQIDNSKSIACIVVENFNNLNGNDCDDMEVYKPLSNKLPVCNLDDVDEEDIYDQLDCDAILVDEDLENE